MPNPDQQLPPEVLDALRRGNPIDAIKLLRTATGLGLAEAKGVIDAQLRRNAEPIFTAPINGPLSANVIAALQRGDKIEAIKLLRAQTGLGLKDANDAVRAIRSEPPVQTGFGPAEVKVAVETSAQQAIPLTSTLSPGEVPRSGGFLWRFAAVVLAIVAGYFFIDA